MNVRRTQNHTPVILKDLDYGSVFEYNDDFYVYVNPRNIKPDCSDTTPVLHNIGIIYYLAKTTQVIHYPDAELQLGNAFKNR